MNHLTNNSKPTTQMHEVRCSCATVYIFDVPPWSVFDILGPSDKHHLYVCYKVLFHTDATFFNSLVKKRRTFSQENWEQETKIHSKMEKAHRKAENDLKMIITNLNEMK